MNASSMHRQPSQPPKVPMGHWSHSSAPEMFMKCPATNESRARILGKSGKWSESYLYHPTSDNNINININTIQHPPTSTSTFSRRETIWNPMPGPTRHGIQAVIPVSGLAVPGAQGTHWAIPGSLPRFFMEEPWRNPWNFWGNMKYLCGKSLLIKNKVILIVIYCDMKVCTSYVLCPLAL